MHMCFLFCSLHFAIANIILNAFLFFLFVLVTEWFQHGSRFKRSSCQLIVWRCCRANQCNVTRLNQHETCVGGKQKQFTIHWIDYLKYLHCCRLYHVVPIGWSASAWKCVQTDTENEKWFCWKNASSTGRTATETIDDDTHTIFAKTNNQNEINSFRTTIQRKKCETKNNQIPTNGLCEMESNASYNNSNINTFWLFYMVVPVGAECIFACL